MYDAQLVAQGSKDDGTEGYEYYQVTRDSDRAFIGCMICVPIELSNGVVRYWYPSSLIRERGKEPFMSPESCLVKLIKEWKKRTTGR